MGIHPPSPSPASISHVMNNTPESLADQLQSVLEKAAREMPYPIAASARKAIPHLNTDAYAEWSFLVRHVFYDFVHYAAHLMLSELAAGGHKPPLLFHRILDVCGNASEGRLVGFLREAAEYLRPHRHDLDIPELVDLADPHPGDAHQASQRSVIEILSRLVDLRNAIAHSHLPDTVLQQGLREVRECLVQLFAACAWIRNYGLCLDDGRDLMGAELSVHAGAEGLLGVRIRGGLSLRPLILCIQDGKLALLQRFDSEPPRMVFRSPHGIHPFAKNQLSDPRLWAVYDEIRSLLQSVRAVEAPLETYAWEAFRERASIHTSRTLADYSSQEAAKYRPDQYVPRTDWEGPDGYWARFLTSDRSLLFLSAGQGEGKSALAARLAENALQNGHAVFFLDAFRLTFVPEPRLSENPLGQYFANMMHFTSPVDRDAIKRIARQAPRERKVVFIIDSVNEIQAFAAVWNRFRVMDCLLEWACAMKHPDFKLMITCNASEFTEYGYLSPEDLPAHLEQTAWSCPHTNGWMNPLRSMTEAEAREMVHRLSETHDPLAPAFTWEVLKEQAGTNLPELIQNPLLFRVFLRMHAGKDKVLTMNPESLYTQYMEGLTGSLEQGNRSRWRQWISFIRNGNLTPKERFLAALIARMSKTGNTFVLADSLVGNNERDAVAVSKELLAPHSEIIDDLKKGGLLKDETIEVEGTTRSTTVVRRLSLVADAMTGALGNILHKVSERFRAQSDFIILLWLFCVVTLSLLAGRQILVANELHSMTSYKDAVTSLPISGLAQSVVLQKIEVIEQTKAKIIFDSLQNNGAILFASGFLMYGFSFLKFSNNNKTWMSRCLGFMGNAACSIIDIEEAKTVRKLVVILMWVGILVCIPLMIAKPTTSVWISIESVVISLFGVMFFLLSLMFIPLNVRFLAAVYAQIPAPIAIRALQQYKDLFLDAQLWDKLRAQFTVTPLAINMTIVGLTGLALWLVGATHATTMPFDAGSYHEWLIGLRSVHDPRLHSGMIGDESEELVILVTGFLTIGIVVLHYLEVLAFRIAPQKSQWKMDALKTRLSPAIAYRRLLAIGLAFTIVPAVVALSWDFFRWRNPNHNDQTFEVALNRMLSQSPDGVIYDQETNHLEILSTATPTVLLDHRSALKEIRILTIHAPASAAPHFSLQHLPSISSLNAPLAAIRDLNRNWMAARQSWRKFIAHDPGGFFGQGSARLPVFQMRITGQVTNLAAIHRICPLLSTLSFHEQEAGEALLTLAPRFPEHIVLIVDGETPPRLEWITPLLRRNPVNLMHPPDGQTRLHALQKLIIPASTDLQLLAGCDSLRWLHITMINREIATNDWFQTLSDLVSEHLPNLETIEFSDGEVPILTRPLDNGQAHGRESILRHLEDLEKSPSSLFESPSSLFEGGWEFVPATKGS